MRTANPSQVEKEMNSVERARSLLKTIKKYEKYGGEDWLIGLLAKDLQIIALRGFNKGLQHLAGEELPEASRLPFTVTVALENAAVGVRLRLPTAKGTFSA